MKLIINSTDYLNPPAHVGDAGWDVVARSEPNIVGKTAFGPYWEKIDYIEYDTGLEIAPEDGYHTLVMPRSSISKTNLFLRNSVGLIDNGYRGTIKLRFGYIFQPSDMIIHGNALIGEIATDKIYQLNDKIGQLVFMKTVEPIDISVDFLNKTTRASGSFGSTGS